MNRQGHAFHGWFYIETEMINPYRESEFPKNPSQPFSLENTHLIAITLSFKEVKLQKAN